MLPEFLNQELLKRALTHTSYANEHMTNGGALMEDNERLEFLGDAILDFVAAKWLYHHFPELDEGRLTSLRAALVRASTLAQFAESIQLSDSLLLGKGEAGKRRAASGEYPQRRFRSAHGRTLSGPGLRGRVRLLRTDD